MRINWPKIHLRRPSPLRLLLLGTLTLPYGAGVLLRSYLYRLIRRRHLPGKVISVGNISVGGTGKTPAVCMLAQWARDEGYRVTVLSRGYRGRYAEGVLHVSDGGGIYSDPRECGDEPYMLATKLRNVPVVVSKDRYLGGLNAYKKYNSDLFILDDGFQHLKLERDIDIVLMDSINPFGNGYLLPLGPLREPIGHLSRADIFLLTHCDDGARKDELESFLLDRFPNKPLFYCAHVPDSVYMPYAGKEFPPDILKGLKVAGFTGIGSPDSFRKTLVSAGAEVVFFRAFDDHYQYKKEDITSLFRSKQLTAADLLITTEKDWVKIGILGKGISDLAFLSIKFIS